MPLWTDIPAPVSAIGIRARMMASAARATCASVAASGAFCAIVRSSSARDGARGEGERVHRHPGFERLQFERARLHGWVVDQIVHPRLLNRHDRAPAVILHV